MTKRAGILSVLFTTASPRLRIVPGIWLVPNNSCWIKNWINELKQLGKVMTLCYGQSNSLHRLFISFILTMASSRWYYHLPFANKDTNTQKIVQVSQLWKSGVDLLSNRQESWAILYSLCCLSLYPSVNDFPKTALKHMQGKWMF